VVANLQKPYQLLTLLNGCNDRSCYFKTQVCDHIVDLALYKTINMTFY